MSCWLVPWLQQRIVLLLKIRDVSQLKINLFLDKQTYENKMLSICIEYRKINWTLSNFKILSLELPVYSFLGLNRFGFSSSFMITSNRFLLRVTDFEQKYSIVLFEPVSAATWSVAIGACRADSTLSRYTWKSAWIEKFYNKTVTFNITYYSVN